MKLVGANLLQFQAGLKEGESDREIAAKSLFTARKDKANLQYRGLPEYSFYEHLGECNTHFELISRTSPTIWTNASLFIITGCRQAKAANA